MSTRILNKLRLCVDSYEDLELYKKYRTSAQEEYGLELWKKYRERLARIYEEESVETLTAQKWIQVWVKFCDNQIYWTRKIDPSTTIICNKGEVFRVDLNNCGIIKEDLEGNMYSEVKECIKSSRDYYHKVHCYRGLKKVKDTFNNYSFWRIMCNTLTEVVYEGEDDE